MPTIHVLHVIDRLHAVGGAEVSLRQFIEDSSAQVRHTVVTLHPVEGSSAGPDPRQTRVLSPPAGWRGGRAATIRHVVDAIRSEAPDLVHTSLFEADLAGRVAAYRTGVPVLTTLVNTPYLAGMPAIERVSPTKQRLVRAVDRVLADRATSAFHAISRSVADHATEQLGIETSRIRVIPRGRSLARLGQRTPQRRWAVRRQLGWGARPVILNVARQEPQKGHVDLLRAVRRVLAAEPDALLVLAGREGRSTRDVCQLLGELGIDASVHQLGVRHDVPDLLAAADVFAFSSLYEGLGGAVVEACGLALPVVSYDVPAVREVLGDTHPWLIPIGDEERLAAALLEALRDEEEAGAVGAVQHARFLERFQLETCTSAMVELYQDLVAATGPRTHRLGRMRTVPVGDR
jgi:glycosyltransferase involved in cell wall biosynthesis